MTIGALCFGLVAGYLTYRTLVRTTKDAKISDLSAVLSSVGGGAATALVGKASDAFGWYAIGLAAGMSIYMALYTLLNGRGKAAEVLGGDQRAR
ncbi:MAG: hypothetical protein ACRDRL_24545 [Sciscionella sp.]